MSTQNQLLDILTGLASDNPYAQGVRDLLVLLNLLDTGGDPTGEVAGMILDSLRAHAATRRPILFDWNDLDSSPPRGVDWLRAVESARLAADPDTAPTRIVSVVQAIWKDGTGAYLMQYDAHAGRYQPLGGKIDSQDSTPEAALCREIGEELGLTGPPGPDICALEDLESHWHEQTVSATYGVLTRYTFHFFAVRRWSPSLDLPPETRFISQAEMSRGQAGDEHAVSDVLLRGVGIERLRNIAGPE